MFGFVWVRSGFDMKTCLRRDDHQSAAKWRICCRIFSEVTLRKAAAPCAITRSPPIATSASPRCAKPGGRLSLKADFRLLDAP